MIARLMKTKGSGNSRLQRTGHFWWRVV